MEREPLAKMIKEEAEEIAMNSLYPDPAETVIFL